MTDKIEAQSVEIICTTVDGRIQKWFFPLRLWDVSIDAKMKAGYVPEDVDSKIKE